MSLLDIRKKFITRSGRFDLVVDTTSYVDSGANDYINDGQKLLDLLQPTDKSEAIRTATLTIADASYIVDRVRSIKEVWIDDLGSNKSKGRSQLLEMDRSVLYAEWADPIADITNDRPTHYAIDTLRDTALEINETRRRIQFRPPADFAYTLEIKGSFLSPRLGDLSDIFINDNFVDNKAFTSGIGDWTEGSGGVLASTASGQAGNGGRYTVGAAPSTTLMSLTTGLKKLIIGREYTLTFHSQFVTNWDGGIVTVTVDGQTATYTPTSSFVLITFTFTAVATSASIAFTCASAPTQNDILWIDTFDYVETGVQESSWTEIYPEILVLASLHELEGAYRNNEGRNDYMKQINERLDGIDHELVFEEAFNISQMGG